MDAILFKMLSRSIIVFAMVIALFFFFKRKKFHSKLTNKEDIVLKIIAVILVCISLYKMFLPIILDIPCYRNGQFETITGYARDNADGKGNEIIEVLEFYICIDDNHEEYVEFPYLRELTRETF